MYLKCDGLKESDQSRCRARNCDGACSWLPQLVRGAEDDICCVEGDHPDDHRLLRFDPCGCLLGLDMFTTQVNMHATSGLGEGRIAKSSVTGQFAFACPMGHRDSFVHDIRTSIRMGVAAPHKDATVAHPNASIKVIWSKYIYI